MLMHMNTGVQAAAKAVDGSCASRPHYRVRLLLGGSARAERQLIDLIQRARGDLHGLERRNPRRPEQLDLHLGQRRIHDVVVSLEAAGFAVAAVIATQASG